MFFIFYFTTVLMALMASVSYNRFGQNQAELDDAAKPSSEFRALVVTGGTEVDIDDVRVSRKRSV